MKSKKQKKPKRILKAKFIRPSQITTYDKAKKALEMISEGKRRIEQSGYEAILTQLFQKYIRIQGDCVLRNVKKPWRDGGDISAGHVFSRKVKELKWDERNCYPQCMSCNSMHRTYPTIYHDWARTKLGDVEYNKIKEIATSKQVFIISYEDVMNLIKKYNEQI